MRIKNPNTNFTKWICVHCEKKGKKSTAIVTYKNNCLCYNCAIKYDLLYSSKKQTA